MSVVAESLSKLILGAPRTQRNPSLLPLLGAGTVKPGFLLLDAGDREGRGLVVHPVRIRQAPAADDAGGGARGSRIARASQRRHDRQ